MKTIASAPLSVVNCATGVRMGSHWRWLLYAMLLIGLPVACTVLVYFFGINQQTAYITMLVVIAGGVFIDEKFIKH